MTAAALGVAADENTTQGHGHGDDHGKTETTSDNHSSAGDSHHSDGTSSHQSDEGGDGHHADDSGGDHHGDGSAAWLTSIAGLVAIAALPVAPAYWYGKQRDRFSDVDAGPAVAIGLILVRAAVHLYLFVQHEEVVMLLAGLGFVGAVVLFLLGVSRRLLYAVGIP
ncbi:hypothetical protein [Haladaptatus litoreus]|uniref:hypothetical protein n=1 Tax=Haladaptatus litoreus TaxID=553468 RepID=UPI0011155D81|nr:hypothetical protein [Haladaptatus litoreus]